MATIVTRAGKGSPLTNNEVDANFTNLNSDKVETSAISTFGGTLIDDADAAAAQATLGLVIGTDVQAHDAVLDATTASFTTALESKLNGIEASADVTDTTNVTAAGALMDSEVDANIKTLSLPASVTISAFGATLVDDADAAAAIATLGLDSSLSTFALPDNTTISAFGATLVDDADASAARTTLGLAIGTDVQAYNADTLFADASDNLTAGFSSDVEAIGNSGTGTVTLQLSDTKENLKTLTVNGSFTLAPQTADSVIAMIVTNDGTGGYTITTTGYDLVSGTYNDTASAVHLFRSTVISGTQILEILEIA